MNEETIKNRIVIPYLEKLGLSKATMEFETNFKIYFPRSNGVNIEGKVKNIYSDILIKCFYKGVLHNIFIVEVKRSEHVLNERDRDQGLCYARLLEEIAPFVIVTNGSDIKVYDTISGEEINDFLGRPIVFKISKKDRELAEQQLAKLTKDNIVDICRRISLTNFGSNTALGYIQTNLLLVERNEYVQDLYDFYESASKVYGLTGVSGIGKTFILYNFFIKYNKQFPILYIDLDSINKGILEYIKDILDMYFGVSDSVFRFLNQVVGNEAKVIVILDSIENSRNITQLRNEIENVIASSYDKASHYFKWVLSCTLDETMQDSWRKLVKKRGEIGLIEQTMYKKSSLYNEVTISIDVKRLSDVEQTEMWRKYSEFYNVSGELRGELKELSKNPLMIFLISESFRDDNLNSDITRKEFYRQWWDRKKQQVSDESFATVVLNKIVNEMVTRQCLSLEEDNVLEELFSYNAKVLEIINEMITLNILMKTGRYLKFYNANLQMYYYCYLYKDFSKWAPSELVKEFNSYEGTYIYPYETFYLGFEYKREYLCDKTNTCPICGKQIRKNDSCVFQYHVNLINGHYRQKVCITHSECKGPDIFQYMDMRLKDFFVSPEDIAAISGISRILFDSSEEELKRRTQYLFKKMEDIDKKRDVVCYCIVYKNQNGKQSYNIEKKPVLFCNRKQAQHCIDAYINQGESSVMYFPHPFTRDEIRIIAKQSKDEQKSALLQFENYEQIIQNKEKIPVCIKSLDGKNLLCFYEITWEELIN